MHLIAQFSSLAFLCNWFSDLVFPSPGVRMPSGFSTFISYFFSFVLLNNLFSALNVQAVYVIPNYIHPQYNPPQFIRGDSRDPATIAKSSGFQSKADTFGYTPDLIISTHVMPITWNRVTADNDAYVSTSVDVDVCKAFMKKTGGNGYVYWISTNQNFVDVQGSLRQYNKHSSEKEWAHKGSIPWYRISSWDIYTAYKPTETKTKNADFAHGTADQIAGRPDYYHAFLGGHEAWHRQPWSNCQKGNPKSCLSGPEGAYPAGLNAEESTNHGGGIIKPSPLLKAQDGSLYTRPYNGYYNIKGVNKGKYAPKPDQKEQGGGESLKVKYGMFYNLKYQNNKFHEDDQPFQGEYHGEYFENGSWKGKFNPSKLSKEGGGSGGKVVLQVGPDGKQFYYSGKLFAGWHDGYLYDMGLKTGKYNSYY